MAQATKIEWCDVSWNPVHGCSRVSTGCKHCYAETLSLRYGQTKAPWTALNAAQNVLLKPHKLREPLSKAKPWDKPCRVFVNSMKRRAA
jgi:protein gp37